jgi:LysR family transcriptional activator of nhaA
VDTLNYHHLRYFWVVAREGGLVQAGKVLRLSHPTLSAQIHALEADLGEKLFSKVGRKLELTETGRVVYRYAEEIFSLGREMIDATRGRLTGQPLRLEVGLVDVVPKLVARRLLQPALNSQPSVRLICHEDNFEKLLARLALHELDIVISDAPIPTGSSVRAFNHLLGESPVSIFGEARLSRAYRRGFPGSLKGAPFLLPIEGSPLRRALNSWLDEHQIAPRIVGEFEDSALMKVFGADGLGLFAAPSVVAEEIMSQYQVELLGEASGVRERFYAVSIERRLKNPAVVAISEAARLKLFPT